MDQAQSQYKTFLTMPKRATWASQKYPIWIPDDFETVKTPEEPYSFLMYIICDWQMVFFGQDENGSFEYNKNFNHWVKWWQQNIVPKTKLNFWNPPSRINPEW